LAKNTVYTSTAVVLIAARKQGFMPLTEAQKIDIRALLQVRQQTGMLALGKLAFSALETKMNALGSEAISAAEEILAEYDKIKYETGRLQGEYNDDPNQKRALLRNRLITLLDFDPADYAEKNPWELGRG
jgi:hypothetical protein